MSNRTNIKMNIGIQETDHFEGVYPVIRLFDNGRNNLVLFVQRTTYQRLQDLLPASATPITWVIQEPGESTWSFCQKMKAAIRELEVTLLYLNTISKHHILYANLLRSLRKTNVILTVHDVNCLFKPSFSLTPRGFLQYIGKKWLVQQVMHFNTVSTTVKPYLQSCAGITRLVLTIPGAVYERQQVKQKDFSTWNIVVPGTLDSKRRNYDHVFEFLDKVDMPTVKLILLGGGNSLFAQEIRQKALKYGNRLQVFDQEIVDQEIFDQVMDQAHFVWIPSVIDTKICGSIPEKYGVTKSSGNLFDIIKHAKPFFYPDSLVIPDNLKSSGVGYENIQQLIELMQTYERSTDSYKAMEVAALTNSAQYTITKIREDNYPLFEGRMPAFSNAGTN